MTSFLLHINLIYWTPICGQYFRNGSLLEKCEKIWKNRRFYRRLWPDWGNTAWAAMVRLGSIELYKFSELDTSIDRAKYCLLFDVQNIKIPAFVREIPLFQQSRLRSPVSILKFYIVLWF